MKNEQIKRSVLIEFVFGNENKNEVGKWIKEIYPKSYHAIKKSLKSTKIVNFAPREIELITKEEKTAILDRVSVEEETHFTTAQY